MRSADPVWLLLAVGLMVSSLVIRAYRWLMLLRGLGSDVRFGRLTALYFIGNFFNAFLPSGMGGDVVRAIEATRDVPADIAAGTVIVDRMAGLLMLFAMALLALPFRPANFPDVWFLIILTISIVGLLAGWLVLDGRIIRWLATLFAKRGDNIMTRLINQKLMPILLAVQGCGWTAVSKAFTISIVFNLMLVTWWYAAARSLGLAIDWGYHFLVVPILSIAQLIPAFGGLGPREFFAPLLYDGAGVSSEGAFALALTVFILWRFTSLLGFPVYLFSTVRRRN